MATLEQELTQSAEKYWDKHKRPRWNGTTNGVSVPAFHGKKPDMMLGSEVDDPFTKCIVVEIKPTKEGVINDFTKKEVYHTCKHLAGIYFVGNESRGARFKWINGKIEQISVDTPLQKFLDDLYEIYKGEVNPEVLNTIRDMQELIVKTNKNTVMDICSGSFCGIEMPKDLSYSEIEFWKQCNKITRTDERIKIIHDVVFAPETRDARYQLGQFITEGYHTFKIAEAVVNVFDVHPDRDMDVVIYEPCVGTGAIAAELITLLFRKYGPRKAKHIIECQLKLADIDPSMRAYAHIVLSEKTKELFGSPLDVKIEASDLEKDSFDLSKMIVYGNYPFNKGTDRNYLARIIRKQLDSGLNHAVIMSAESIVDNKKVQIKRILGEDFYSKIVVQYRTTDFEFAQCPIVVFTYTGKSQPFSLVSATMSSRFGTVESELKVGMSKLKYLIPLGLMNGEHMDKTTYDPANSLPYYKQPQLRDNVYDLRVPSAVAPKGSHENEMYTTWIAENSQKKYLSKYTIGPKLIVGNIVSPKYMCRLKYFKDTVDVGDVHLLSIVGRENVLSFLALILQSTIFRSILYAHFPKLFKTDYRIDVNKLKTLPIPIETPENKDQFSRLYEIGQKLIIEGIEDKELRKEADDILEQLYKGLEV